MYEENAEEIGRQREWHIRARDGDRQALAELYRSMLPLIKSRARRVLYPGHDAWYDADDLQQDCFLLFHRFVMRSDPRVPLYRLVAGAFERALRRHLRRLARCRSAGPALEFDREAGARPDDGSEALPAHGPSPFEVACAAELLAALDGEEERTLALLAAQGYSGRALADCLGLTPAAVQGRRRRLRARLAAHGIHPP
jgi:DNA-directed RNA polymerase specialized sigma24 family protein